MDNNGGRVSYTLGDKVRILSLNGTVSKDVYTIEQEKSDRKGHVALLDSKGKELRVNHRRILPFATEATACVVEIGDKFKVVCPSCGFVGTIRIVSDKYTCENCNNEHQCHWINTKPLKEIIKEAKVIKPKVEDKMQKETREAVVIDLNALASLPNCKLYTKKNVKFDHERIDVKAHVLVFNDGQSSRKMCFNTYNGTLGKKLVDLPTQDFIDGKESSRFFAINDMNKAMEKLRKDGYEEHGIS